MAKRRRPFPKQWTIPISESFNSLLSESLGRCWGEYTEAMYRRIYTAVPEPRIVVEIGCSEGCWSSFVLRRFPSVQHLFGIDVWDARGSVKRKRRRNNFKHLSMAWMESVAPWLWTKAIPLRGLSAEWGEVFPHTIDLLFVDGCHQYEETLSDLQLYATKVRPQGLVLVHDIKMPKVIRAMNDFFGEQNWTVDAEANVGFVIK